MGRLLLITPTLGRRRAVDYEEVVCRGGEPCEWALVCPPDQVGSIRSILGGLPNTRILAEHRAGMYAAINSAMRECPGEWFSYINDDDRLERGFGEMLREHCVPANERVIAYGRVDMIDEAGRRLYGFPSTGRAGDIAALWCEGIMPFTQQGMIAHRSVWDAVGGFDENYRYSGDLDFWVRARQCGFRFKYYNKTVACWRIRRGQLSANKAGVRRETTRALTPVMAHPPSWWRRLSAKARFRLVNIPCYLGRWARLGRLRQSEVFN